MKITFLCCHYLHSFGCRHIWLYWCK